MKTTLLRGIFAAQAPVAAATMLRTVGLLSMPDGVLFALGPGWAATGAALLVLAWAAAEAGRYAAASRSPARLRSPVPCSRSCTT